MKRKIHLIEKVMLLFGSFFVIFPFVWMILSSFKTSPEIAKLPPSILPEHFTLNNFARIFSMMPFTRYFLNSVLVSTSIMIIVLFTSSLGGYIFAKFKFPWKEPIFITVLAAMMAPFEVKALPLFLIVEKMNLIDNYGGLIVPFIVDSFGILLMRQYIHGIPTAYIESARLDGLSEFGIYIRIILPLVKPALAALAIFCFIWQWDFLLWPLLIINSQKYKTVPLGLVSFSTQAGPVFNLTSAASTVAVVPTLVVFLLFQRYFIKGVTLTGLK